jgi:hypothetical protein
MIFASKYSLMKKIALLLTTAIITKSATAQTISITPTSLLYTQDFNSLGTSASSPYNTILPTGWSIAERGSGSAADSKYRGGNGSDNSGDTYSFGATGSTERALGSLSSSSVKPIYGAIFTNNTGTAITSFTVTYKAEQWRMGTSTTDSLQFCYSTTATHIDTSLYGFTTVRDLYATAINTSAPQGALDGNDPANSRVLSFTINTTILPSATIAFAWSDPDAAGSDHGLAVDSLSVLFTTLPNTPYPSILALSPLTSSTGVEPHSNLEIIFSKQVQKGTGDIVIKDVSTQTINTIPVSSSDVAINSNVVTISNAGLSPNSSYYVLVDSNAFDTAGYKSSGIYDTTVWQFSTGLNSVSGIQKQKQLPVMVFGTATSSGIDLGFTVTKATEVSVSVYDLIGRETYRTSTNAVSGLNRVMLRPRNLSSGMYIVRVSTDDNFGVAKTIIH